MRDRAVFKARYCERWIARGRAFEVGLDDNARIVAFLLAMTDSAIGLTLASVAGPETRMSTVKLWAAGSACSEMTEKGCAFDRVGGGAPPHPMNALNTRAALIALNIDSSALTSTLLCYPDW